MRLTKSVIEQAGYEGESYRGKDGRTKWCRCVLWDDEVHGLGVRVLPTGRKKFILSYRVRQRKRLLTLGDFGVLTLDQARKRAIRELGGILEGHDPLAARETIRQAPTVKELARRYMEEHAIPKKKPRSAKEDQRLLEKFVLPVLGSRLVPDVSRDDVAKLHHSLREIPIQANRVLALVSMLMTMAEKWELRPEGSNPCRHVDRFPERKRERYLSSQELIRLGEVLNEAERTGSEVPEVMTAIRLLLLTGCRREEILQLEWRSVDLERGLLLLPDSKTGAKAVPLGAAALELLASLPRLADSPYVLPGRNGTGHFVGIHHPWTRLRKQAGLEDVRLHDLRHSFASVGVGDGLSLPMIGKLLGHTQVSTTQRYAHLANDPLRRAADQISGAIAAGLSGEDSPSAS